MRIMRKPLFAVNDTLVLSHNGKNYEFIVTKIPCGMFGGKLRFSYIGRLFFDGKEVDSHKTICDSDEYLLKRSLQ